MRALLALALVLGCGTATAADARPCAGLEDAPPFLPVPTYESDWRSDVTHYEIAPTSRTPGCVLVQGNLDHDAIDAEIDLVEAVTGYTVNRAGIIAVEAPDCRDVGSTQAFPCDDGPYRLCVGAVQHRAAVVTCSDLDAFAHEVKHLISTQPHAGPIYDSEREHAERQAGGE